VGGLAVMEKMMTAKTAQYLLASVFFGLGGWCLIAPGTVMTLAFTPAYQSGDPIVPILVACFGAQAMLAGVFAAFSIFTRRTFLAYGIALLPFFVFDYWFYAVEPMLTLVGLLDVAGNLIMLWLCWIGWTRSGETK
jgi:hypothetical protein